MAEYANQFGLRLRVEPYGRQSNSAYYTNLANKELRGDANDGHRKAREGVAAIT